MTTRSSLVAAKRGAFTLVEVVVSLALGATLLCAALALVVQSQRLHGRLTAAAVVADQRMLPLRLLQDDLAASPSGAGIILDDYGVQFDTFNAFATPRAVGRCPTRVRYLIERSNDGSIGITRQEQERGAFDSAEALYSRLDSPMAEFRCTLFNGRQWHSKRTSEDAWPVWALAVEYRARDDSEITRRVFPLAPPAWRHHQAR